MNPYSQHRPTQYDSHIEMAEREDWLVLPVSRTRDSQPYEESNFDAALKRLGGESDTVEVHRFGHWGPGWYEIILVKPGTPAETEANAIVEALDIYPILDEHDCSEREQEAARETWKACYSTAQRVKYIRDHRSQFEFHDMADMMACVRGKYFAGYASEMIA